uniref:Endoribonuclease n=1 Tax=Plectus sambesii TaxID=2011161 RepID=A0A914UHX2_9BILA
LHQILDRNLFDPQVCDVESTNGLKTGLEQQFINLVTNTTVFQLAYQYLQAHGAAGNDKPAFMQTLFYLWFGTYSRCNPKIGSSGWEHVYSGEWNKDTIDGQHNWVRFYLLEKAGDMNYYGYYSHDGDLTGTFQYKWKTYLKEEGGFLIGTSPEFDFSLFTVCVLTASGSNACKFSIDGYPLAVTSYKQACAVGQCLSTSYPTN